MKPYGLVFFIPALLISGCQSPRPPVPQVTPSHASPAVTPLSVRRGQNLLRQTGAFNQRVVHLPGAINANSQRVSVDWDGDAVELLAQLARQRGLTFSYNGVRLPLPVDIHAQSMTFDSLLRDISAQIGWRATLSQRPAELRLYYTLPDKGGRLA